MTELVYNQGNDEYLLEKVNSLKREINNEESIRKKQEREIQIIGQMEKDIKKKLSLLENTLDKMSSQKKKSMGGIYHQRSTSNPEDAINLQVQKFSKEEPYTRSSDDFSHAPLQRVSQSYEYRRLKRGAIPVTPETRRRQVQSPVPQSHEIKRSQHGSANNLVQSSEYRSEMERPHTRNIYPCPNHSPIPKKKNALVIENRPSPISKAMSTGITSNRSRTADGGYDSRDVRSKVKYSHLSSGAINPREVANARIINTNQLQQNRSSSAFGMYKTNMNGSNSNSLPRILGIESGRGSHVEMRRKDPVTTVQENGKYERSHSMENLLEKRPLAKTNSTILDCSDFKIISLESRTIAQQIKLKELKKDYVSKSRILNKTEWVSFVSQFSETQKEVRNLDIEWQEFFSEMMSRDTEYNQHMNEIRKWVTALKEDSKFLQDIMSDNLATAL